MSTSIMTPSDDLIELARVLADWVQSAPPFKIYLYGSRVRGDHRRTSDVDIIISFGDATISDNMWWGLMNDENFRSINALLPGKLEILEHNDPLVSKLLAAPVVHQDRQVTCVWMKPKPS